MKKIALILVLAVAACRESPAPVETSTGAKTTTATPPATATGIEAGSMMPAYTAANLDGSKFDLASKRGKVVLVNLWATWCGPCRYEIPELQRMHNEYAARGFEVIGVSVDDAEVAIVQDFVNEQKVTYPIVHDPAQTLPNLFQISVLPTSILVDRNGKIVLKKVGAILEGDEELKAAIEKTL